MDLAVGHKYERNFGSGRDVAHFREGISVERLFSIAGLALAAAPMRLGLLRWILVQYLIGNSDAHGKNISFFIEPGGLRLAPSYDLVAVRVYPKVDHELAMAIGDEFDITKVRAHDWAELAMHCGLERRLVAREMTRMTKQLRKMLPELQAGPGNSLLNDHKNGILLEEELSRFREENVRFRKLLANSRDCVGSRNRPGTFTIAGSPGPSWQPTFNGGKVALFRCARRENRMVR